MTSTRSTASDRREQIRAIAAEEFASRGLHGASVETIARRAGISQSYVFRLFRTKRALFEDVVVAAFDRTTDGMRRAARDLRGEAALDAMAAEYVALLRDPVTLRLQHQGFAASADSEVRTAVRAAFGRLWVAVSEASGLEPERVKTFVAVGMLHNDFAAIDLLGMTEPWAHDARVRVSFGG